MIIQPAEWLQMTKEDRLLCIRLSVCENMQKQRKQNASKYKKVRRG